MQFSSQQILDGIPLGVIVTDLRGQIVGVNAAVRDLLRYDEAELVGKALDSLNVDQGSLLNQSALEDVAAGRPHRPYILDVAFRFGDIPVEMQPGAIVDDHGKPTGALFVVQLFTMPKGNLPGAERPRRRSGPRGRR